MTPAPATKIRALAARVDAATPAHRDRTVDALRALAICGVILGHWLVTALVLTPGGTLRDASPLASIPALTPASWIFQTLAVFFCVGGYASARSYRGGYLAWLRQRLIRLSRPVAALAAVWVLLGSGMWLAGVSGSTLHTVLTLVLDPLWFLGVYAGLTALTPVAVTLVRRLGAAAALIPLAVVAAVDAVRLGLGGPSWVGWINVVAGWLVPYLLGIAWARGAFASRKLPALMLAGGVAATIALIVWAGYPASMVGVNGARISNLNPPSLAVVTFGIAQVGLALLLRGPLARLMRRPVAWAAVAMANLSAMTLFLWHQTAFLAVTAAGLLVGRLPGLHTAPTSAVWVAERIAWLPVFAMALAVLVTVFRRAERAPRQQDRAPRQQDRAPRQQDRAPRQQDRATSASRIRRPGTSGAPAGVRPRGNRPRPPRRARRSGARWLAGRVARRRSSRTRGGGRRAAAPRRCPGGVPHAGTARAAW